jgi:hypothetical protein
MTYSVLRGCEIAIPDIVGNIVSLIYLAIRIGIPVILLIVGMVDLGKAVVAQKEDEIKKAQGLLVKKVISAVMVFLLFTLIQFAINLVDNANGNNAGMWSCVNAILGNTLTDGAKCPEGYTPANDKDNKYCVQGTSAQNNNNQNNNNNGGNVEVPQ